MYTTTTRRGANHGLHLIMTVLTLGMWGLFVWPVAAAMGRKQTVTHHGVSQAWDNIPVRPGHPAWTQGHNAHHVVPQANAVNPYNGQAYYDPQQGRYQR